MLLAENPQTMRNGLRPLPNMCILHIITGLQSMPTKNVQTTLIGDLLQSLHGSVIDIVGVMARPQQDEALIRDAGIPLDRALFPLLVLVERLGPLGVVELAGRVGRDYTTVSRQVGKLESLGLVQRREHAADRRVREAVITAKGKRMTGRIDAAREQMGRAIFETWSARDLQTLARLMRRFADAVQQEPNDGTP
jgi:DNA-binding MarR family transcriptional regulator